MTDLWDFVGWLLFGDLDVSLAQLLWTAVLGWWLRGKHDERRLRKAWLRSWGDQHDVTGGRP